MRFRWSVAILISALFGCSSEPTRRGGEVELPPTPSAPRSTASASPKGTPKLVQVSRAEGASFSSLEEMKWVVAAPKGDRFATGGGPSGSIMLWDAKGRALGILEGRDVLAADFSPDGRKLAAIAPREGLVVFDVETRKRLRVEPRTGGMIYVLTVSPDGSQVVTSDAEGVVELWSVDGKSPRREIARYKEVADVAFSSDGRSIVVAAEGVTLDRWEIAGGTKTSLRVQGTKLRHVALAADGKSILTAELDGKDEVVRLRDASSGAVRQTMRGHSAHIDAIAFSPDGRSIASGSGDGTVRLWDAASGREQRVLSTKGKAVWAVGYDASGATVYAAGQGRSLHGWSTIDGAPIAVSGAHANAVTSLAYAPDGATLVSGDNEGEVFVHQAGGGSSRRALKLDRKVQSLSFSTDGATLRSVSSAGLQRWDAKTFAPRDTLALGPFADVVFSPDESELTVGDTSRVVTLRSASDGGVLRSFGEAQPHDDGRQNLMTPSSVSFSPDGTMIAIARWDQPVELWDRRTGARVRSLEGTLAVAFSPDGTKIATGDGVVSKRGGPLSLKLVDVATGKAEHTFDGEPEAMFLPGGAYLMGSRGGELRIWNVKTGKLETSTPAHRVLSFTVSRDGNRVATGSLDGAVTEFAVWGE